MQFSASHERGKNGECGKLADQLSGWRLRAVARLEGAGIRVNPSALGVNPAVIKPIGEVPGIRLIVQPVTLQGETVVIHDFTAHVCFDFVTNSAMPFSPDKAAFGGIVNDLKGIKTFLEQAQVTPRTRR